MLKQNVGIKEVNLILTWNPSMMHKYHGGTSLILYNSFLDWLSSMTSNELSCCTDPSLPFTCTCMPLSWWSDCISSVAERNLQIRLELYKCRFYILTYVILTVYILKLERVEIKFSATCSEIVSCWTNKFKFCNNEI